MSRLRLLYLHYQHRATAGPNAISGKLLVQHLKSELHQVVQAHMVVDEETTRSAYSSFADDVLSPAEIKEIGINAIYCEGGIRSSFSDEDGFIWKMAAEQIEAFVQGGGIFITSDLDINFARTRDAQFARLSMSSFKFSDDSYGRADAIYFVDPARSLDSGWRDILVDVDSMKRGIDEWLRPVFEGVDEVGVGGPLELQGYQTALAYIRSDTVGTMCQDTWWASPTKGFDPSRIIYHADGPQGIDASGAFASVAQLGTGFFVTLAGLLSLDSFVKRCPGNAKLVRNLVHHLNSVSAAQSEETLFQSLRKQRLFLSHRSVDKPLVEDVSDLLRKRGVRVWLDKDQLLPSDSLGMGISVGLSECTHFVLFWSKSCVGAPWVNFELGSAISACVEQGKAILIVCLDETTLPPAINQFLRIGRHLSADDTASRLTSAVLALRNRASAP